jgi:hypothetical protein
MRGCFELFIGTVFLFIHGIQTYNFVCLCVYNPDTKWSTDLQS